MDHDKLPKTYFGNNGSRRVIVTQANDWYQLSGVFDWGTSSGGSLQLAAAILADMGASRACVLRYAQKLMLNVISKCPRERRLALDEIDILNGLGCKAVDDLCKVEEGHGSD